MRRIFPHPLLWLALLAMWLLLDGVGVGQVLLGIIVASLACWAVVALEPPKPRIRGIGSIIQVIGIVIGDIALSNIAVLRLILGGRQPRSVFVTIPITCTSPG